MAESQQEQKKQTNYHKKETLKLMKKNKVWLRLGKQFLIERKSKKLNQKNAKYTIKKILNSHSIKLDILKDINNIFYINKLHTTNTDPLFSQSVNNTQPPSIQNNDKDKQIIKKIIIKIKKKKENKRKNIK